MIWHGGHADEVRLEAEERGWELVVESEHGTYRFNVHGIVGQFIKMGDEAARYFEEGRMAALAHEQDMAKQRTDEFYDWMVGDA